MILTNILLGILISGGGFLIIKKKIKESYQTGFRAGMAYSLRYKKKKDEAKSLDD